MPEKETRQYKGYTWVYKICPVRVLFFKLTENYTNQQLINRATSVGNHSLARSADRESQDKNFVGLVNQFAKTSCSCNSVDSIFTHVYP